MKVEDLEFFKSLDKDFMDGTVQDIVYNNSSAPMLYCLKKLCTNLKNEKDTLQKENKHLANILKKHGLYTTENILGDNL